MSNHTEYTPNGKISWEDYQTTLAVIKDVGILLIKTLITLNSLALLPIIGFHFQYPNDFDKNDIIYSCLFFYLGIATALICAIIAYFYAQKSIDNPKIVDWKYLFCVGFPYFLSFIFFTAGLARAVFF
tara:strand:- start:711 stop:1094 length:384 start_codon:yes stop_codon:yes gene_type:complete